MSKVLFISDFLLEPNIGAHVVSKSHLEILQEIYGENEVDVIVLCGQEQNKKSKYLTYPSYKTKLGKLRNILQFNHFYINNSIETKIMRQIQVEKYEVIFLDNSLYGKLVRKIKKKFPNLIVISFYHDVKANLSKEWLKKFGLNYLLVHYTTLYNEKLTANYSDYNITLSLRESNEFKNFYKKNSDLELPIIIKDTYNLAMNQSINEDNRSMSLLFVGTYYYPNVNGVKWFIRNVINNLDINYKFVIVGKGMEKLKDDLNITELDNNIQIIGEVDDLSKWYYDADIVVGPIFEGAGMKVKTAEALMYGKTYLGTKEALEGYIDLEEYQCNTAEEFIKKIIYFSGNNVKFNSQIRRLYEQNYSISSAKNKLLSILENTCK